MKTIFTIFLIALLCSGVNAQWQQTNGPEGGFTSHLRKVSNYLFVNTNAGGIFRSADDGVTWSAANNGMPAYAHCYYLANHENKLYAAVYQNGVYFSEDFGETWSPINHGIETLTAYSLAVNGNDIYAGAANGGFYYSADHGASWTLHDGALTGLPIRDFVISGDHVFAGANGVSGKAGVYLSEDKGLTWTRLGLAIDHINTFSGYDNALYVSDGSMKISRDYGATWSAASIETGGFAITVIQAVGDEVNVGAATGTLFSSEDEGQTWAQKSGTPSDTHYISIFSAGQQFWVATDIGVAYSGDDAVTWVARDNGLRATVVDYLRTDGDTLMAVSDRLGLSTSWNGGSSWMRVPIWTAGQSHMVVSGIHTSSTYKVAGTSQGIFRTHSLQMSEWEQALTAAEQKAISTLAGDGDRIVASVYQQGVFVSTDGGELWNFKSTEVFGDKGLMCSVVKGDTIVIGGSDGIFVSTDFGTTWQTTNVPPAFFFPYGVLFEETSLIFVTSQGIFKSENLGASWSAIDDLPAEIRPEDMVISADGTYYAATSAGVYASYDKGLKWFAVNKDLISPTTSLAIVGAQLYAGTYGRSVWVTGIDQLNAKPNVVQQATEFAITNEETVALTLSDFATEDPDSQSLTLVVGEGTNYTVSDNVITPVAGFVGDLSVPVQVDDGFQLSEVFHATVTVVPIVVGTIASEGSLKVYPNPASERIFIEDAHAPEFRIVLMDHFGKVIRQEAASAPSGYSMDLSSLPAGLYLLRIKSKTDSRIVRFSKK